MNSLFKDVFFIFKFFQDIFLGIQKLLTPPKAYSWQTFIYLSVFSWGVSYLATGYIKDLIAFCGWLFLVAGTAWYTTDDPLRVPGTFMPVGAVVTGFLVSMFAFGHQVNGVTPRTIVIWPTLAAIITALPEFFEGKGSVAKATMPKLEVRQKTIILIAWSMLISCWIQFYFVLDKWSKEYPTLLTDDFKRSAFVIRVDEKPKNSKNGENILNKLQPLVEQQIVNRPWSQVERWLIDSNRQLGNLGNNIITKNLDKFEEQKLWKVEPRIVNVKSGYRLDILSIWMGPSSNSQGYYLKKSCLIEPVASRTNPENTIAEIKCDRTSKFIPGSPPPKQ
ncbi:septal junction protein FraD [Cronbergia sp. UHCC 0137]|uniref:septal junction protein FraD n=1 Tax=Cronbergia sp. UHCC 0137 TaxID=3110239 RepID=UPI002B20D49D|nr:septal junction protein FraD [Cronbergia sp. UHCC 0137]MEA5618953.1 septal junction protein FraD [Cronbergia sp. UHCC 0137]